MKELLESIPAQIPDEIIEYAKKDAVGRRKFVKWLQMWKDELVVRTFAYHETKVDGFEITEVERKCPHWDMAITKNTFFTYYGGWNAVFSPRDVEMKSGYYGYGGTWFESWEFDVWMTNNKMGIWGPIINLDLLYTIPKYKYCGYSGYYGLCEYLALYEKHPSVEYFGKLGIQPYKSLVRLAEKDRAFCKFIVKNADDVPRYGASATITAYKQHLSVKEAAEKNEYERKAKRETRDFYNIKESGVDQVKLYRWIRNNCISLYSYADYFKAISILGYDLKDTKNLYPREFGRMHDLRTQEYAAYKEKQELKQKRKMTTKIKKLSKKYAEFLIENEEFCIVLPNGVKDFIDEGKALNHCVGRMGYDKKMADGKCVIAFIRMKSAPDVPFVTVEWLTDKKIVSQCYAAHDSKPKKEVIDFANAWGENMKKGWKNLAV